MTEAAEGRGRKQEGGSMGGKEVERAEAAAMCVCVRESECSRARVYV